METLYFKNRENKLIPFTGENLINFLEPEPKEKQFYPRDLLDKYLSGSCFDIYSNCNSKFRSLEYGRTTKDKEKQNFWIERIKLISEVTNMLFAIFYIKERSIKSEADFNNVIKLFKRFAMMKTGRSWENICYAGK